MTTSIRKPRPAEIVECLIEMYLATGVDLKDITLEEFKRRFRELATTIAQQCA